MADQNPDEAIDVEATDLANSTETETATTAAPGARPKPSVGAIPESVVFVQPPPVQ